MYLVDSLCASLDVGPGQFDCWEISTLHHLALALYNI